MKNFNNIMKALIVGGALISSNVQAEDMCTPRPTCESLGFTKTATICQGQDTLKCPFDNNKVYCYKQSDIIPTYQLFDILRIDGVNIGEIIYLNSGKTSGRVMTQGGENFSTAAGQPEASAEYCKNLKRGGLDWRLINDEDLKYLVFDNNLEKCDAANKSSISISIYYCTKTSTISLSTYQNTSSCPVGTRYFYGFNSYNNRIYGSDNKYFNDCQARCVAEF